MTTVAHNSPVVLAPVAAVNSLEFVDELWSVGGMDDSIFDDGASDTEKLIAAAGAVEKLEWELDRAQTVLADAVEKAASGGCPVETIAESTGMTREDVVTLLWAARSERNQK